MRYDHVPGSAMTGRPRSVRSIEPRSAWACPPFPIPCRPQSNTATDASLSHPSRSVANPPSEKSRDPPAGCETGAAAAARSTAGPSSQATSSDDAVAGQASVPSPVIAAAAAIVGRTSLAGPGSRKSRRPPSSSPISGIVPSGRVTWRRNTAPRRRASVTCCGTSTPLRRPRATAWTKKSTVYRA